MYEQLKDEWLKEVVQMQTWPNRQKEQFSCKNNILTIFTFISLMNYFISEYSITSSLKSTHKNIFGWCWWKCNWGQLMEVSLCQEKRLGSPDITWKSIPEYQEWDHHLKCNEDICKIHSKQDKWTKCRSVYSPQQISKSIEKRGNTKRERSLEHYKNKMPVHIDKIQTKYKFRLLCLE